MSNCEREQTQRNQQNCKKIFVKILKIPDHGCPPGLNLLLFLIYIKKLALFDDQNGYRANYFFSCCTTDFFRFPCRWATGLQLPISDWKESSLRNQMNGIELERS
jgi:hypothetical protein